MIRSKRLFLPTLSLHPHLAVPAKSGRVCLQVLSGFLAETDTGRQIVPLFCQAQHLLSRVESRCLSQVGGDSALNSLAVAETYNKYVCETVC